jgi:hypothetical protein
MGQDFSSKNVASFFTCSCTETQSQEQTLHSTGDLFEFWYPLAHERQVAKAKEQIEKISNRKTGRNKKHAHFHTIAHCNWLEVWSCDILCFPFWTKVPIFFWRAIIVFLFLLLASIWTEGQKTPHWSLQGWCQDILRKKHATMLQKSCRPIIYILPGCCFLLSFGWASCCTVVCYTHPVTIGRVLWVVWILEPNLDSIIWFIWDPISNVLGFPQSSRHVRQSHTISRDSRDFSIESDNLLCPVVKIWWHGLRSQILMTFQCRQILLTWILRVSERPFGATKNDKIILARISC